MIRDILENGGYRKKELLELILEWKEIEDRVYEVDFWPYDYMNYFCSSIWWEYHDKVLDFLLDLDLRRVIQDFKRDDNFDGYGPDDLISGWFTDSETWKVDASITNEMAELFLKYWWKYRIYCDMEKVKLFYDIVFWGKQYHCTLVTVKALLKFLKSIDRETLVDWIKLDEKYVFSDVEVQLKAILSSNYSNIAKLYYYISKHVDPFDWERFLIWPLEFEINVITENSPNYVEEKYIKSYDKYYILKEVPEWKDYIQEMYHKWFWNVKYLYDTKQLQIWNKLIPFKWAKLQVEFLEYLIKNSDRSVSSIEIKNIWITDMKYTIDDIKDKLKKYNVSQKEYKELFHYFVDDWIKYCRILL